MTRGQCAAISVAVFWAATIFCIFPGFSQSVIDDIRLVITVLGNDGRLRPLTGQVVPNIPNRACYNWVARVASSIAEIHVKDTLVLPVGAVIWPDDVTTKQDKSVGTFEGNIKADGGIVQRGYCVAPGDPDGIYTWHVTVNGGEERTFRFEVRTPGPTT